MSDGITICITAYKAKKYIKETLDSILVQTWFKTHDNYEVLVGIDGCEETLDYLKTIQENYPHLKVLMMDTNRGTYITTNTLINEAKYNNIIRFDSDDIMLPNMVEKIMRCAENCDIIRYYLQDFGADYKKYVSDGSCFFKKSFMLKFGGYQPWKCSADTEMKKRLRKFGHHKQINDVLFLRRTHNESLTRKPGETTIFGGAVGDYRKKCLDYVAKLNVRSEKDAKIKMVTNSFAETFNSMDVVSTNYVPEILEIIDKIQKEVKITKKINLDEYSELFYMSDNFKENAQKKKIDLKKRMTTIKRNRVYKQVYYNY